MVLISQTIKQTLYYFSIKHWPSRARHKTPKLPCLDHTWTTWTPRSHVSLAAWWRCHPAGLRTFCWRLREKKAASHLTVGGFGSRIFLFDTQHTRPAEDWNVSCLACLWGDICCPKLSFILRFLQGYQGIRQWNIYLLKLIKKLKGLSHKMGFLCIFKLWV